MKGPSLSRDFQAQDSGPGPVPGLGGDDRGGEGRTQCHGYQPHCGRCWDGLKRRWYCRAGPLGKVSWSRFGGSGHSWKDWDVGADGD